jgi:hypothetical protein
LLSGTEQANVRSRLVEYNGASYTTVNNDELIDGHSRLDTFSMALANLAYVGYGTTSVSLLTDSINFWWGGNSGLTLGGAAALDTNRYASSCCGNIKGPAYSFLADWGTLLFLHVIKNAMTGITLDGVAYDPVNDEQWIGQMPLWYLHLGLRGDLDFFKLGDSNRIVNPLFGTQARGVVSFLSAKPSSGQYRRRMHWMYDQLNSLKPTENGSYVRAPDFVFVPKEDTSLSALDPAQPPALEKLRVFDVPGCFVYQSSWDKPNGSITFFNAPRFYYQGHPALDAGMIQITYKNDVVLCNSGFYDTGEANAGPGGTHNQYWDKLSISKSGIVLFDDGSVTPHEDYGNPSGTLNSYPSGEGGQYFKIFGSARDPKTVAMMQNDGGGEAWKRCDGRTAATGLELINTFTSGYTFYVNTRRAYLKEYTDIDTSADRCRGCEYRIFLITDQTPEQIVFMAVRAQSKSPASSITKAQTWHFWGDPGNPGIAGAAKNLWDLKGRVVASGQNGTGKIVIDYYRQQDYDIVQVGDADASFTSVNGAKFRYNPHGVDTSTNYPPTDNPSTRYLQDVGRFYVKVTPKVKSIEDNFVCLLRPMAVATTPVDVSFSDTVGFWLLTFPDGKVYQISKTGASFVSSESEVDVMPPGATVLSGTAGNASAALGWTALNADPTMVGGKYRAYCRVKV